MWLVPSITGAGINSAILGKLGGKNRSQIPIPSAEKPGELSVEEQAGATAAMNLSMFIKVHPHPLPGKESTESLGSLTSHSIIKQKTTTLNAYNTHRRTHPANLQHKAIQFRALMDLTIAVKGEFTTDIKAQRIGGATL